VLPAGSWGADEPRPQESGPFLLFYQAVELLVVGEFFTAFKCLQELAALGLTLVTPVSALSFAALPSLLSFRAVVGWIELAVWAAALVMSLSMLAWALRSRNRLPLRQSI
jgi:hypothetical protein